MTSASAASPSVASRTSRVEGEAVVSFGVEDDVELPVDSTVAVRWRNLIGQRYLSVVPGTAAEPLEGGDEVDRAEDVVDLGRVVNQLSPLAQAIGPDQVNRILASPAETGRATGGERVIATG